MGRSLRRVTAALALGCVLSAPVAAVAAAGGETGDRRATAAHVRRSLAAAPRAAAAPPAPGWVVDRVDIEPLDPLTKPLTVAGLGAYPGRLAVTRAPGGGLGVLNQVSFEDYVRGISEMPSAWPLEALKAQAIAARTYALWSVRRGARAPVPAHRAAGADICASQSCQVYTGLAKVRAPHGERWAAAVAATEGQLLWWRDGPILAKYSSSNGGRTVPGGQPYLRAVDDPDDAHSPLHRWRSTIASADLARVFALRAEPTRVTREGDVIVIETPAGGTDPSSGPDGTAPGGDGSPGEPPPGEPPPGEPPPGDAPPGHHLSVHVVEFRDRLNAALAPPPGLPRRIPSVRFALAPGDGGIVLDGRGWGHGIGLSQWGAFGKAHRGMRAADILGAYYAGIRPAPVPPGQLPPSIVVALALDRPVVEASAENGGRFRIVDGTGATLAHAATGTWRLEPAPAGKVRVRPPADQASAAPVQHLETTPKEPRPGQAITVRLRVPHAAVVSARAAPPPAGSPRAVGDAILVAAGEVKLRLPPAADPGAYEITVDTDLGGGRTSTTALAVDVVAGDGERGGHRDRAARGARGSRSGAPGDAIGPPSGTGAGGDGGDGGVGFDTATATAGRVDTLAASPGASPGVADSAAGAGTGSATGVGPPTTALGALASITVHSTVAPRVVVLLAAIGVATVGRRAVRAVRLGRRPGAPLHWQGP